MPVQYRAMSATCCAWQGSEAGVHVLKAAETSLGERADVCQKPARMASTQASPPTLRNASVTTLFQEYSSQSGVTPSLVVPGKPKMGAEAASAMSTMCG